MPIESPADDIEAPAERPARPPSAQKISAEPPRWRFVSDAKKSSGYSSLAAGQYVQGKTSDELGAKYTAPDISLYKDKGDKPEVGKLQRQFPAVDEHTKDDVEVGKLQLQSPDDETPPIPENQAGELENKPEEDDVMKDDEGGAVKGVAEDDDGDALKDDATEDVPTKKESSVDGSKKSGDVESNLSCTSVPTCIGSNEEKPDQTIPKPNEGEQLGEEKAISPSGHTDCDSSVSSSSKEDNHKKRRRILYFLLLLLLLTVVWMGALLGRKSGSGEVSAAPDNAAAKPEVQGPVVIANYTIRPSPYPSSALSNEPSGAPSLSRPSKDPSAEPTKKPTSTPSKKPSPPPTVPPTKVLTSKPTYTCSSDSALIPFDICIAVDMSGSLCNGPSGILCLGCPDSYPATATPPEQHVCRQSWISRADCCSNFRDVKKMGTVIVDSLGELPVEKSFSVVQFANDAKLANGLSSTSETLSTMERLVYSGGQGAHSLAITTCQQSFSSSPYPGRKKIIILMTDGRSGIPLGIPLDAAESIASSAKDDGTIIIPVLVPTDRPDSNRGSIPYFNGMSSDGETIDATNNDVSKLMQVQEKLRKYVACPRDQNELT